MQLEIAQSTPTAASIGRLVQSLYDLGEVVESDFLRRGFNLVYRLSFADGRRVVVRLCSERPRGAPNVVFEAALLEHFAREGCHVARCLRAANGDAVVHVRLPEGLRALMVFEYLEGEPSGNSVEDVEVLAHGLAELHVAGESYTGPASAYQLDLDLLLQQPLERLLRFPTLTAELRSRFQAVGERLHRDILAFGELSRVHCHGDAHGGNNFIASDAHGKRIATFFDFDDAGPGYLAYELAVFPWSIHPRGPETKLDSTTEALWLGYLSSYRERRVIPEADLAALERFMAVRQFWFLGEFAGRSTISGSQTLPLSYLLRQATLLEEWEALKLPR